MVPISSTRCILHPFIPLGLPISVLATVHKQQKKGKLNELWVRRAYGMLYLSYSSGAWYFEALDMLYKLIMTSLLVFLNPVTTRLQAGSLLCICFIILILLGRPYKKAKDDALQLMAQNYY